eukprot:NODE_1556_length_1495_cov_44.502766_g1404_i0.p1 GENE.NODE_1556_length_1495_cov_44.502766_g1404_i0~~NODE_1556_length_1495_cov_44.502766_g1404_i0.p1  ORF type:complete len:451 (+),score=92.11 NODE_1556_length_1495_cov_44.502766_g1404_i0:53-1354(+)
MDAFRPSIVSCQRCSVRFGFLTWRYSCFVCGATCCLACCQSRCVRPEDVATRSSNRRLCSLCVCRLVEDKLLGSQLAELQRDYNSLSEFTQQLECAFRRKAEALDLAIIEAERSDREADHPKLSCVNVEAEESEETPLVLLNAAAQTSTVVVQANASQTDGGFLATLEKEGTHLINAAVQTVDGDDFLLGEPAITSLAQDTVQEDSRLHSVVCSLETELADVHAALTVAQSEKAAMLVELNAAKALANAQKKQPVATEKKMPFSHVPGAQGIALERCRSTSFSNLAETQSQKELKQQVRSLTRRLQAAEDCVAHATQTMEEMKQVLLDKETCSRGIQGENSINTSQEVSDLLSLVGEIHSSMEEIQRCSIDATAHNRRKKKGQSASNCSNFGLQPSSPRCSEGSFSSEFSCENSTPQHMRPQSLLQRDRGHTK